MKQVTLEQLKAIAKELVDDTNKEYNRGICELIADVEFIAGLDHAERAMVIAHELGLKESIY